MGEECPECGASVRDDHTKHDEFYVVIGYLCWVCGHRWEPEKAEDHD